MIYLLYCLFAYFDGQGDGILYSRKGASALPGNEHTYLVMRRFVASLLYAGGFCYGATMGWKGLMLLGVDTLCIALAFSFWHNGAYNLMRDKIGGTTKGWQYSSPTDTSKYNFTYPQRRNMFYLSVAILVIAYFAFFFVL